MSQLRGIKRLGIWIFAVLGVGLFGLGLGGCQRFGEAPPATRLVHTTTPSPERRPSPTLEPRTPTQGLPASPTLQPTPQPNEGSPTPTPDCAAKFHELLAQHGRDFSQCDVTLQTFEALCPAPRALDPATLTLNIEVILDASGSMAQRTPDGQTRLQAAREALIDLVQNLPEEGVNLALRVYGHVGSNREEDRERSCQATELLYPFQPLDREAFFDAIQRFQPKGWTPLARSLDAAREDFRQLREADPEAYALASNVVLLVTDGEDTCGGDPVAAAQRLRQSDLRVKVYVVGFSLEPQAKASLQRIAEVADGAFYDVNTRAQLQDVLQELVNRGEWLHYLQCLRENRDAFLQNSLDTLLEAQACYHRLRDEEREALLRAILALQRDPEYGVCVDPMLAWLDDREALYDQQAKRLQSLFRALDEEMERINRLIDALAEQTP